MCEERDERKESESDIEITPEMMAAGVAIFRAADLRFESAEDIVAEIFEAMMLRQRLVGKGDAPQHP